MEFLGCGLSTTSHRPLTLLLLLPKSLTHSLTHSHSFTHAYTHTQSDRAMPPAAKKKSKKPKKAKEAKPPKEELLRHQVPLTHLLTHSLTRPTFLMIVCVCLCVAGGEGTHEMRKRSQNSTSSKIGSKMQNPARRRVQ
jgi:hypothetical protein